MELDEFKAQWNNMQEKEIERQKLTTETLNNIIMKTTTTLGELQTKNAYWSKLGTAVCSMLIGVMLIYLVILYFVPKPNQSFGESLLLIGIILIFGLVSIWFYQKQERIFKINTNENLKDALRKTILNFKKFYVLLNVTYLFLFPAYYYAVLKLFSTFLSLSENTIWLISGAFTVISFVVNHWYYSIHYLKRVKVLQRNLNELS